MSAFDGLRLVGGARTAFLAPGDHFRSLAAHFLGASAFSLAGERAGVDPSELSQIVMGSLFAAGTGPNPAQRAATESGLSENILSSTIKAGPGSPLVALLQAAHMLGEGEKALVGGMDSVSTQPYLLPGARFGSRLGASQMVDGAAAEAWTGEDDVPLAVTAAMVAQRYQLGDDAVRAWGKERRERGLAALKDGGDQGRLARVEVLMRREALIVREDGELQKAKAQLLAPMADGAAVVVLAKGGEGPELKAWARAGVSPNRTPMAPIEAVSALLAKMGREARDITHLEIDETLGVTPMAAAKELGLEASRINPLGSSLSFGYAGAASAGMGLLNLQQQLTVKGGLGVISYGLGAGGSLALAFEA